MSEFMEVIKQRNRMCANYVYCRGGCPLWDPFTGAAMINCGEFMKAEPEKFEKLVMEWAKKHPEKTMMDVFFEKFPDAPKRSNGTPTLCPDKVGLAKKKTEPCRKDDCLECWSRPAPDNI